MSVFQPSEENGDEEMQPVTDERSDLREEALRRLKKKRDFQAHLLAYVLVNVVLWAIWAVIFAASGAWFPWPIFASLGWGIGLVFHAWDVYGWSPFTEDQIQREEARLRVSSEKETK